MPTSDAERTAIHEAGHAIAALETGCDLRAAAVKGARGATEWTYYDRADAAVVTAAGVAAERHMLKGGRQVQGSDRKRMRALWREARAEGSVQKGFDGWLREQTVEAVRLLHGRHKCLRRLSNALQRKGRLTADEIRRTVAPTTPTAFTPAQKRRLTWRDRQQADLRAKSAVKAAGRAGGAPDLEVWKAEQLARAEEYGKILAQKCRQQGHDGACAVL